jgi:uncharacterized protein YaaW (UPF0174 family)
MNDVIEAIRHGELYPLLSLCTKEDLDPLAEAVLSRLSNFLDVDPDYKKYKPDHTKYYKIIGDEIRLFGGHTVRNIFRGNEGPAYSEIVVDVCNKLRVPYIKGDTVRNEANLLDIFVEQRWQSLDPAEQQRLTEEARKTAAGKISTASSIGTVAVLGFIVQRAALGPAGWAVLGISLFDANFKVTIPCVLHIAYLRRRILEDWREDGPILLPGPQTPTAEVRAGSLVIAAEDGEPVLSLARIPAPPEKADWHRIGASDDGISRLSPLLAAVPSLAVAGEVANTNYMKVVCNGSLVAAKKGGGFRGFSMNSDGIKAHANLFEPDKLAAMVNVSALMNVASIALAQKHLADISSKLSDIKDAIDGIRKFQNDERHSKLTGSILYFEQVAPAILEGELPARVLNQIEHHEAELLQVQEHVVEDIRTEIEKLRSLKDDEWFGSAEAKSAIETHQRRIVELYRERILCLRARSCGWQLLCMFPGEEIGKAHRRQDIQKALDKLATDGDLLTETDALLRKRIHELSSFWNAQTTINERKLTLLKANETLLADVAACRCEVLRDLHAADEMLASLRKPVAMVARIEDGRITAIRAL